MLWRVKWGSLRTKIIAWSFVPTMIILVLVAVVMFYAYQEVAEELVIQRNRDLTRLAAGRLTAELKEYADLLDVEARTSGIYGNDSVAQADALKASSNRLAMYDAGRLILDTFGTVVTAEPARPEVVGQDWSDRSYYREILRSQISGSPRPVFSDIVADGPSGLEVIVVAVPVIDPQGGFRGAVVGMFRVGATAVNALCSDIVKLRLGQSGSAYVVDGSGQVIYHTDTDRIGDDFSGHPVVQRALSGQVDAIRTRDYEGVDIVASFSAVPGTSWGLVTQESWGALTHASRRYGRFLLLLLALGVVVPALVVAIGVRRITRPVTALIDAAQNVAGGDFGQTISARTGDELEELGRQFNLMSAQLQESYTHLEQRVADRTRELAALNAIAATVSQSLDLNEVLDDALDKTLEVMGIEAGGIYLLDEEAGVLTIAAQRGLSPHFVSGVDGLKVGEGFSGRVAQSGQPLVARNVSTDPRLSRMVVKEEGLRSLAIVPLSSKGKVLGTLFAVTRGYREFTEADVQLLMSIGHQIGIAVENARLFKAEQRRAEQFRVISEVGRRITSILDIDEVLVEVVRLIQQSFAYDHVSIALIEGDQAVYKVGAGELWDDPQFQFRPARLRLGEEGITGWVAAMGEPLLVPDVSKEPRYVWMRGSRTRSELTVPIKVREEVIGVLDAQSDHLNAFDQIDLVVLQSLAHQAAVAIENARLYDEGQQVAVMQERNRLARDLHDAVTQTLFSASLIAEALPDIWDSDQEEGRQLLKELNRLTRGALAEMRTLLLELRPAALVEASLGDLLRQLGESVTGRAAVPVRVTVEGRCAVPDEVHVALYRIAQEALNNVVKHAHASQVSVGLRCRPAVGGGAELCVRDDGRGFDLSFVPPESLGLGIMRERAAAIGAKLTLESEIGRGAEVTVVWPDAQKQAKDN